MRGENVNKTLKFNFDFKLKLLILLLSDSDFTFKILPYLDKEIFDKISFRTTIRYLIDYVEDVRELPSIDDLENEVKDDKKLSDIDKSEVLDLLDKIRDRINIYTEEKKKILRIKDKFNNFIRNKEMKNLVHNMVEDMEYKHVDNDFIGGVIDECQKLYHATLTDEDYQYLDEENFRNRIQETEGKIKTYLPRIDRYLHGGSGLDYGELFVLVGRPKAGKTTVMSYIGAQNVIHGNDVLHISLENYEQGIGLKYDAAFTGVARTEMISYDRDKLYKKIKSILNKKSSGRFKLKVYPQDTLTISMLEGYLKRLQITEQFYSDLLIVDYADNMKTASYSDDSYSQMRNIYGQLRRIAAEFECVVFTPSQFNREGSKETGFVDSTFIASSFAKIMVADCIVTLARDLNDKSKERAKLLLSDSRVGPDGKMIKVRYNLNRVQIDDIKDESIVEVDNQSAHEIMQKKFQEIQQ